jgi:hypothetical protein
MIPFQNRIGYNVDVEAARTQPGVKRNTPSLGGSEPLQTQKAGPDIQSHPAKKARIENSPKVQFAGIKSSQSNVCPPVSDRDDTKGQY